MTSLSLVCHGDFQIIFETFEMDENWLLTKFQASIDIKTSKSSLTISLFRSLSVSLVSVACHAQTFSFIYNKYSIQTASFGLSSGPFPKNSFNLFDIQAFVATQVIQAKNIGSRQLLANNLESGDRPKKSNFSPAIIYQLDFCTSQLSEIVILLSSIYDFLFVSIFEISKVQERIEH